MSCCNISKEFQLLGLSPLKAFFRRIWYFARKRPVVQLPKHMTKAFDRSPVMDLLADRLAAPSVTAGLDRLELDPGLGRTNC